MTFDFKYYLSVFLRRSPYFIIAVAIFTSLGVTLATILPPEYRANALLLVESEQIPSSLAQSTVQTGANEQLQIIEQQMMTRENLIDIANRLGVYDSLRQNGEVITASDIVSDMRARTSFRTTAGGKNAATVLNIGFSASEANKAAQVTNEFVTLVLQGNVEMRTSRAESTLEFFEQERDRLGGNLDNQSAEILRFQTQNAGALPQDQSSLKDTQVRLRDDKATRQREIDSLTAQRDQMVSIFEETGRLGTRDSKSPEAQALEKARKELENAKLVYSEQNPKLRVLKARVERYADELAESISGASGEAAANDAKSLYSAQLAQTDSEIAFRQEEIERLDDRLEDIGDRLDRIPANAITLDKLKRDYSNIQSQYNTAVSRMSQAATGERIEILAKGQRISVIEQATPPEKPAKPNRLMISAGGAGVGVAAGGALIFLLELLNKSIRRPSEITSRLGITPLAILPYIKTDREVFMKRLVLLSFVVFFVLVVPMALFAVHSFYYPLDRLIEPFANKLGFSIT